MAIQTLNHEELQLVSGGEGGLLGGLDIGGLLTSLLGPTGLIGGLISFVTELLAGLVNTIFAI
jgi:bacteriocin-like protein